MELETLRKRVDELEVENNALRSRIAQLQGEEEWVARPEPETETESGETEAEDDGNVLRFVEDSPFWRSQLTEQESWVSALQNQFKKVSSLLRGFCHAAKEFSKMSEGLSVELCTWTSVEEDVERRLEEEEERRAARNKRYRKRKGSMPFGSSRGSEGGVTSPSVEQDRSASVLSPKTNSGPDVSLKATMFKLGSLLETVAGLTHKLGISVDLLLVSSIGDFEKVFEEITSKRHHFDAADEHHELQMMKTVTRPQAVPKQKKGLVRKKLSEQEWEKQTRDKWAEGDRDVRNARKQFELSRFDYVTLLNTTRNQKQLDLIENTCASFYAFLTFFHEGNYTANCIKEEVSDLHVHIQDKKKVYQQTHDSATRDREALENCVSTKDAAEFEVRQLFPDKTRHQATVFRNGRVVQIEKEGYLRKKSANLLHDWKRRWFALQDGQLYYFRNHKDLKPRLIVNCLISTVRPLGANGEMANMFEIITPTQDRVYTLQAESDHEFAHWISVFQNCAESLLGSQISSTDSNRTADDSVYAMLRDMNGTCVDCGERDPSWASINLGAMICIECSGIHRSMGVHVSKVRSITLDAWDKDLLSMMVALGNDRVNSVFQGALPSGFTKPTPQSPREIKDEFLLLKYIQKAFLSKTVLANTPPSGERVTQFIAAAAAGDVTRLLELVTLGAVVNEGSEELGGSTALHAAAAAGQVVCVEFLLQNNAVATVVDAQGRTPLDVAQAGGAKCADVVERLRRVKQH